MSAASNGGRYANECLVFSIVDRDPELNQAVRWQVSRAEFDKDATRANVPAISKDCFPAQIFNAYVHAGWKARVRTMFHISSSFSPEVLVLEGPQEYRIDKELVRASSINSRF